MSLPPGKVMSVETQTGRTWQGQGCCGNGDGCLASQVESYKDS